MNDASNVPIADVLDAQTEPDSELGSGSRLALYVAVGLAAGSVIALQIDVMRVFSVGSWAHFGSLVVSLAMLGFGLASAVMTVAKDWFARNWRGPRPFRSLCSGRSPSPPTFMCSISASTRSS